MSDSFTDEPPKSNRRRFQFRLRTLMVVVTVFALIPCGYLGWEAKVVRERRLWLAHLQAEGYGPRIGDIVVYAGNGHGGPNNVRRWLGDKEVITIAIPATISEEDKETTLRLFPESNVLQTPAPPKQSAANP
jgi:hypothetical protein